MKTKPASFKVTRKDRAQIDAVVDRAMSFKVQGYSRMTCDMDITACHANGNKLDLAKLLKAEDFNFMHDVMGIARHINRETGELKDFFVPRCSAH